MKKSKLKADLQYDFCASLLKKGLSRKDVVTKLQEKFQLTRRTATTYVYLWFRGSQYRVEAEEKVKAPPKKKAINVRTKTVKKETDKVGKAKRKPSKKRVSSEKAGGKSKKATTKRVVNDPWEF